LPTTERKLQGDVSGFRERLFKFVESLNVELSFSESIATGEGSFRMAARSRFFPGCRQPRNSPRSCMRSPHEMLPSRRPTHVDNQASPRETEGPKLWPFVVCQSIGMQNGTASPGLHPALERRRRSSARESLEAVQTDRCRDPRGHRPPSQRHSRQHNRKT